MIALLFVTLFSMVIYLGLRNPEMTEEDYELYFRTQVMGMTVSTLLTSEVQQMLMERLAPPSQTNVYPHHSEADTLANFRRHQPKDEAEGNEGK